MWWLVATSIGLFYGLAVLMVLALGRAAKVGDQIHRRAAEEWLAERRAEAAGDRKDRRVA
jgi:membrane protein required for beta-lactamase induction